MRFRSPDGSPPQWVAGLVSVVIPTRNRPHLLARAVQRVLAQKGVRLEVVVVDDGSEAAHHALNQAIQQQHPEHVRLVYVPDVAGVGSGPSGARNTGICHGRGEFFAFCDDDDVWASPSHLSAALDAFASRPKLDLYYCNQIAFRDGKQAYDVWQPHLHRALGATRLSASPTSQTLLISKAEALCAAGDFAHMNSCVVRRSLLDRSGMFWIAARYVEDLDMFVRWVDAARDVAYNPHEATHHHIPDRQLRQSASTSLSIAQKHTGINMVAQHLAACCSSNEALSYAQSLGANACMNLARVLSQEGRRRQAVIWIRAALAWQFRPNWLLKAMLLRLRRNNTQHPSG